MNVEELLQRRKIKYLEKGRDYVVRCLNPEHDDSNPSMRIDKTIGVFHCLACGFKGNIFHFFDEKVNELQMKRDLLKKKIETKRAESIGVQIPRDAVPYRGDWRNINEKTYRQFEAFEHYSNEHVGRIVFPIRTLSGKIAGFVGRHTTGGIPKYMVSPHKAKLPLFPRAKPLQGRVILVEGIFDAINLYDKGLQNAVCCFGTQNINEDKLSMLKMQGVDGIDIFFDGDEPGQKAAEKVKIMCEHVGLPYRNIHLKDTDPGALMLHQVEKLKRKLYHDEP